VRQFLPYFQEQSMDVAIIDAVWNGVWQAMKIANTAEAFDVNIAPHNFYSHLATMMNTHFAAAVPNLRIMEHDVDRLPWDDELFTRAPEIEDGHIIVPQVPGWGTEPNEEAMRDRPPKVANGLSRHEVVADGAGASRSGPQGAVRRTRCPGSSVI
jgi:L-alanine-DL-glutamate epimerase-like enolase superfamily enzyme